MLDFLFVLRYGTFKKFTFLSTQVFIVPDRKNISAHDCPSSVHFKTTLKARNSFNGVQQTVDGCCCGLFSAGEAEQTFAGSEPERCIVLCYVCCSEHTTLCCRSCRHKQCARQFITSRRRYDWRVGNEDLLYRRCLFNQCYHSH